MAQNPLTIAITGGTGFVGGFVIREALAQGHKVRAIVRRPAAVAEFTHDHLNWITGGLGDVDTELVDGADVVINIAGLIKSQKVLGYYDVNATAAGMLAETAGNAGVNRFVQLSSMAAREPDLSDYAKSKWIGENMVKEQFGGPVSIIRAPAVFGPGDTATEPFFKLLAKGLLPVPGGGAWKNRLISMTYAPDLAREIVKSAVSGHNDGAIISPANIAKATWPEFGALCEQAFERKIRVMPLPMALLWPVAGVTSITSRLFGMGHLTLDKLGEFRHADWSSETLISDATPPIEALKLTMAAYQGQKDT